MQNQVEAQNEVEINGEPVIDEAEYKLITSISDLKSMYREKYQALQNLRSDICYCDKIVNQCRQRLLVEFNAWYADCFMPVEEIQDKNEDTESLKEEKIVRTVEDEQERFDRLQMELLMENPESVPFYNAKLQTERRLLYADANKKRKPGGVFPQVKNKPPTSLTVN